MKALIRGRSLAGALAFLIPASALASSFQDCTFDCRAAFERAVAQCAGKRIPEQARACRSRADQVRIRCTNLCTSRENQRLRLLQARQRERAEREALRRQRSR